MKTTEQKLLKEFLALIVESTNVPTKEPVVLKGPFEPLHGDDDSKFGMTIEFNLVVTPELATALNIPPENIPDFEGQAEWDLNCTYSGTWFGSHHRATLTDPEEFPEFDLDEWGFTAIGYDGNMVLLTPEDDQLLQNVLSSDKRFMSDFNDRVYKAEEERAKNDFDPPDEPDYEPDDWRY